MSLVFELIYHTFPALLFTNTGIGISNFSIGEAKKKTQEYDGFRISNP